MYNLAILLGIGLTSQAVIALIAFTTPVMAVAAAPSFGVAAVRVGYFMTALYLAASLSAAAGGGLIARFGAIRTTQLCLILCVCGLLFTLAASPPLAILGALLIAVTQAGNSVSVSNGIGIGGNVEGSTVTNQ